MSEPGRSIAMAAVPNLRDLGRWPIAGGGRVRSRQLYRSTELDKLSGDNMRAFEQLGIRTVYDLRTEAERAAQPDRVPTGTEQVVVDVLSDAPGAGPARLVELISDPPAAERALGGGRAVRLFEQGYREIVSLDSALKGYRTLFSGFADQARRPALFHCTTGKDRTGWAAAATLMLLGVGQELVMQEYLLTNAQLLPALQPYFDEFAAKGGDPELLRPVLGVESAYLEAALDEMRRGFGTIEGYFADGLGIGAEEQAELRAALSED